MILSVLRLLRHIALQSAKKLQQRLRLGERMASKTDFKKTCFSSSEASSSLFDHDIDLVAIVHLERLRRVIVLDPLAVEYKSALIVRQALTLAVGLHQLLQLRAFLDLEKDFAAILRLDLDVELFAPSGWRSLPGIASCGCC